MDVSTHALTIGAFNKWKDEFEKRYQKEIEELKRKNDELTRRLATLEPSSATVMETTYAPKPVYRTTTTYDHEAGTVRDYRRTQPTQAHSATMVPVYTGVFQLPSTVQTSHDASQDHVMTMTPVQSPPPSGMYANTVYRR